MRTRLLLASTLAALAFAGDAQALFRAYLSKNGSDLNPCTLALPCRLLPAALAAVDAGGDIWMLDSANYNTATVAVSKSVTILAIPGVVGSIVANGAHAMTVDGADIRVKLRNLAFCYLGGIEPSGIVVTGAAHVDLDEVSVTGMDVGLHVQGATYFSVTASRFLRNFSAVYVTGPAIGTVSRTVVSDCDRGIVAQPSASDSRIRVSVADTEVTGCTIGYGVFAGSNVRMSVTRSQASGNVNGFVQGGAPGSLLAVSTSAATANGTGFANLSSGTFESTQDNLVANNGTDTTGTLTPKAYR